MADTDASTPSLYDKFTTGGPGALFGAPNGVFPGANGQPGYDLGNRLQTAAAWLGSANDPKGSAALLQGIQQAQAQNRPQLVDMGTDLLGMKKWSVYDPRTQQIRKLGAGGSPGGSDAEYGMDSFNTSLSQLQQGKITPDQFHKSMPSVLQTYTDALLHGDAEPTKLGMRNPGIRQASLIAAHALDPNFNENQIPARQAYYKSFISSSPDSVGGQVGAANRLVTHTQELMDAQEKLEKLQPLSGQYNIVNYGMNAIKQGGGDADYKTALKEYRTAAEAVSDEAAKVIVGSKGGVTDRQAYRSLLGDGSLSGQEVRAGVGKIIGLMNGRLDAAADQKNTAFGLSGDKASKGTDFLTGRNKAILNYYAGGGENPGVESPSMRGTVAPQAASGQAVPAPTTISKSSGGAVSPAPSSSSDPLAKARAAIAAGAPKDAVLQRLKQHGIDPGGL